MMQMKIILPPSKLLDMGEVVQEVSRQWGAISLPLSLHLGGVACWLMPTLGLVNVAHTHTRKDVNM